jgi:hypothetical protein
VVTPGDAHLAGTIEAIGMKEVAGTIDGEMAASHPKHVYKGAMATMAVLGSANRKRSRKTSENGEPAAMR